jgi:CheY-like chemotaxis protein
MKPQRILIADDDPKLLTLLKSSLQKEGYATIEAIDGEIAFQQIQQEQPDLILADITMPKLDGFELCQRVRENPELSYIPFIFLTAKGELHDRVKGLNLGADDYISKPFHISEVTARIKVILQRSAMTASQGQDEGELDLRGNLEQMGMAEVIQTLGMNKKTGGLKIINQGSIGKIYFDSGEIVQASLGKYASEEAVYRMISWDEGYFEFDSKDTAAAADIGTTTNSLLMEGFNQREEYQKYKEALPPFNAVLRLTEPSRVHEMKAASQKIAALVDGERTIQDIMTNSPINYLLTLKVLYTFLKKEIAEAIESEQTQDISEEDYTQLAQELYD